MRIKMDFQLNRQFGVVERTIFRLVLNGFTDVKEIGSALPVFSDTVIANGIKQLVNRQIIVASLETGKLHLAEPLVAIINMCIEKTCEVELQPELEEAVKNGGLLVSGVAEEASRSLVQAVLSELLPGVKLDLYVDSIDFVLCEERGGQYE